VVARLGDPKRPLPLDPPTWTLRPAKNLVRIYHRHPLRQPLVPRQWGPLNRFDPHIRDRRGQPRNSPDGRGVLYLADDLTCALAEAFQEELSDVAVCPNVRAIWARARGSAKLLDLTGNGVMYIGAVATASSGDEPRRRTQRWGRAIYEDYAHLAGIRYRAAHQGGMAIALWETAPAVAGLRGQDRGLRERGVWERVVLGFATQGRLPVRIPAADCSQCRDYGLS
jgi:hypothetical protein